MARYCKRLTLPGGADEVLETFDAQGCTEQSKLIRDAVGVSLSEPSSAP
jgi:hypothetical protein